MSKSIVGGVSEAIDDAVDDASKGDWTAAGNSLIVAAAAAAGVAVGGPAAGAAGAILAGAAFRKLLARVSNTAQRRFDAALQVDARESDARSAAREALMALFPALVQLIRESVLDVHESGSAEKLDQLFLAVVDQSSNIRAAIEHHHQAMLSALASSSSTKRSRPNPIWPGVQPSIRVSLHRDNRRVLKFLEDKIRSDLSNSYLVSKEAFAGAMTAMEDALRAAASSEPSVGTLTSVLPNDFRWKITNGTMPTNTFLNHIDTLAKHCKVHGALRVACIATSAAAIAILRDLNQRFESNGLRFEVSYSEVTARGFYESLSVECDAHFAIGSLEALVLAPNRYDLPIKLIGPLYGQRQDAYVNLKPMRGFRTAVHIYDRSSAKFQYHTGHGVQANATEQVFQNIDDVLQIVEGIGAGDTFVAWDPISRVLARRKDYAIVPQSGYMIHFVLLGHERLFDDDEFPMNDFLQVFTTEWRRRQLEPSDLTSMLLQDQHFMDLFARAAGHRWVWEP